MTDPTKHGVSVFDGLVDAPSDLSAAIARVRERLSRHGDIPGALDAELTLVLAAAEQWNAYNERKQRVIAAGMGRSPLRDAAERASAPSEPVLRKFDHASEDRAKLALYAIGEAMGYGWAQAELGAEWERRHDCAPRGRMGVTVSDAPPAQAEPRPAPDVEQEPETISEMLARHDSESREAILRVHERMSAPSAQPDYAALMAALCPRNQVDGKHDWETRTPKHVQCRWCHEIVPVTPAQAEPQPELLDVKLTAADGRTVQVFPQPAQAEPQTEPSTCWLIERGQKEFHTPTIWYAGGSSHPDDARYDGRWTENANRAIRFSTQEECEATVYNEFMRYWGDRRVNCHASEHVFLERPSIAATDRAYIEAMQRAFADPDSQVILTHDAFTRLCNAALGAKESP